MLPLHKTEKPQHPLPLPEKAQPIRDCEIARQKSLPRTLEIEKPSHSSLHTPNSRYKIPPSFPLLFTVSNAFLRIPMASKLKVEELRNQLAQRGLTTTGNKPTLVSLTTPLSPSLSSLGRRDFDQLLILSSCSFRGSRSLFAKKTSNPPTQVMFQLQLLVERGEDNQMKMESQLGPRKSRPPTSSRT